MKKIILLLLLCMVSFSVLNAQEKSLTGRVTDDKSEPLLGVTVSVDEAFTMGRKDKNTIKQQVYDDFDLAIHNLPISYCGSELSHATRGAAMAMKARTALYLGDYAIARDAAKACMDLHIYELYPSYRDLFLSKTKNTKETIFAIPRSIPLNSQLSSDYPVKATITRNVGGWVQYNPSWELFSSYTCTDGLSINESNLFDPKKSFKNRDPRLAMTIVPFGLIG